MKKVSKYLGICGIMENQFKQIVGTFHEDLSPEEKRKVKPGDENINLAFRRFSIVTIPAILSRGKQDERGIEMRIFSYEKQDKKAQELTEAIRTALDTEGVLVSSTPLTKHPSTGGIFLIYSYGIQVIMKCPEDAVKPQESPTQLDEEFKLTPVEIYVQSKLNSNKISKAKAAPKRPEKKCNP